VVTVSDSSNAPTDEGYIASIVVPAHNEEERGFATLDLLKRLSGEFRCLVVIVCNGCRDRTVELARTVPNARVQETQVASKSNALNAGDDLAGDVFPRIYLDADVDTSPESLLELVNALRDDQPRAVGPNVRHETRAAPWLVRAYFEAMDTIPFLIQLRMHHLEGRGLYGVNLAGRKKFDRFPPIRADDAFFDRVFDAEEKLTVESAVVRVPVPRTLGAFLRGQTRTAIGTWELNDWMDEHHPERIVVSPYQAHPRLSLRRRILHYHETSGLITSWHPHTIYITGAYFFVEAISRTNAAARRAARSSVGWR
jgi:hypothetical protein